MYMFLMNSHESVCFLPRVTWLCRGQAVSFLTSGQPAEFDAVYSSQIVDLVFN